MLNKTELKTKCKNKLKNNISDSNIFGEGNNTSDMLQILNYILKKNLFSMCVH